MLDGKATTLTGAVAKGRTLTLRLTKPASRLPAPSDERLCAVPPTLPADPEGARAPLPSPAPYYAAQYVPGERLVLERNRFYRGERPHHVDRFVANLDADPARPSTQIASGSSTAVSACPGSCRAHAELVQRYGVNKSGSSGSSPATGLRMFVLNTSQPLFKNNPKLRQAVNFAIDRRALARELGPSSAPPPTSTCPRPARLQERAHLPAQGARREEGKAAREGTHAKRQGSALHAELSLPIDVARRRSSSRTSRRSASRSRSCRSRLPLLFGKMATRGEPFDIGCIGWFGGCATPRPPLDLRRAHDRRAPTSGTGRTSTRRSTTGFSTQASRLTGVERDRAYGELDVQLARDAAPAIPLRRHQCDHVRLRQGRLHRPQPEPRPDGCLPQVTRRARGHAVRGARPHPGGGHARDQGGRHVPHGRSHGRRRRRRPCTCRVHSRRTASDVCWTHVLSQQAAAGGSSHCARARAVPPRGVEGRSHIYVHVEKRHALFDGRCRVCP